MKHSNKLKIVNTHLNYPKVTLTSKSDNYYLHIAAEIDKSSIPFFLRKSDKKKKLITHCKQKLTSIKKMDGVINCSVFTATLIPPGRGKYILENAKETHWAKFDLVFLLEFNSLDKLSAFQEKVIYLDLLASIKQAASYTHIITASNIRRIGPVNHKKQGVFLFNYFYAKDIEQNLLVWEYTAGWFEKETNLNNSTLLLPSGKSKYTIINHCRWNSFWNILPHLLFKKSFKTYVLDNFYANNVGAQPILYKLA